MESVFFEAFKKNWPVLLLLIYVVYEVRAVRTDMSNEIQGVRTEMSNEIQGVRTEMSNEIQRVRTEIAHLGQKFESYKLDTDSKLNWLRDDQKEIRAELKPKRRPASQ